MSWGRLCGPYRTRRAVVVTRVWALLWASSRVKGDWARPVVIVLSLEVRWRMPVVLFSVGPSSTSAHSAGVEREGGRCSLRCNFCESVRPLAQRADLVEGQGRPVSAEHLQ